MASGEFSRGKGRAIEEAGFDASLLPEGSRTPGTEPFPRAVSDYFQKSYASMGGQLSVVFAAGRIEVAGGRAMNGAFENDISHPLPEQGLGDAASAALGGGLDQPVVGCDLQCAGRPAARM